MSDRQSDAELVRRLQAIEQYGSSEQAANKFGVAASSFRESIREAKRRGLTPATKIKDPLAKALADVKSLRARVVELEREDESAEAIRAEIWKIAEHSPEAPNWLSRDTGSNGARGMPVLLASDWHYGEVVQPDEVGGVNHFNSEIAAKRIKRMADTTVDLCFNHMGRAKTIYPGIVLCLGGDMISGDIHEELFATNDRTPQQCINDLTDLIGGVIETLVSKFGRVHIPCVTGNHGRSSRKPRYKGRVYCVDAETPVLTRDLKWVPAGSLRVGDPIVGFDENQTEPRGRRWSPAEITHSHVQYADTVRIELENGEVLWATPEHKFLAHGGRGSSSAEWKSAAEILKQFTGKRKNKGTWKLDRFLNVWEQDHSRDAGYLAGVFDGEGTLAVKIKSSGYSRAQLSVTQYANACLAETKRCLTALGFEYNESVVLNAHNKNCHYLTLRGGLPEVLRFLGQVRPPRLLEKWSRFDTDERYMMKMSSDKIVSVKEGGWRRIAVLSSSSKTYMTAGYASHNTSHEWNIYCNLVREYRKNDRITFDVPNQTDARFRVYGHRYLLTHGDNLGVKGGDGIIGALGPIMRGTIKIRNAESQIGRDFDTVLMGHWHQYLTLPGLIVNNSLKGTDEYARLALRAPHSRPSQALWFTHPEHGITAHWQVYLEGLQHPKQPKTLEWTT